MSLRWNGHGSANVELVHMRWELLFMLQGDRNHWQPAGAEELGWRVVSPPWVASHWLHSLAGTQLLMPLSCSCQASPQGTLFIAKQSANMNFGLFTAPGWGPLCCLSGTVSLWEMQLCFNTTFWKQRGELWVGSDSASVTASCEGVLGWRIPSRHQLLVFH